MKRFRPDSLAPVSLTRIPVMLNMGLSSSRELLQLVHQRVEESCRDILSRSADVTQDVRLITMARNDVPTSLNVLSNIIMDRMMSIDERENAFFLLTKLADDLMQIGAIYMAGKIADDLPPPVTPRDLATTAGLASGEARRANAEQGWQTTALRLALKVMQDGKERSANKLGNEVWKNWDDPGTALNDPKLICAHLKSVAEGDDPPFRLKVRQARKEFSEANRSLPK